MTLKNISFGLIVYQISIIYGKNGYLHLYETISSVFIQNATVE